MNKEKENPIPVFDTEKIISGISMEEAEALKQVQKQFMENYLEHKDDMSVEDWLYTQMKKTLPSYSDEEVIQMSSEIISTLKIQEEKKASMEKAIANGRSKEDWFASETKKATSFMGAQETSKYLQNLDKAVDEANKALNIAIHTKAQNISQNPNLDGYIAEEYHAQTFNLNAAAKESTYKAKVLKPEGHRYGKNSVDIVIENENGRTVQRYQAKYCKDTKSTEQAFGKGDYRGQRKLVPEGQDTIRKSHTVLEAPDGTQSNPLSKEQAKKVQNEVQSGKWEKLDWNQYEVKDIARGIGKKTGQAALVGAAMGTGFDVAKKVWNGEKIKGEDLVETALASGADFGVKAATAGALKVGAEKGIISFIPKGTPADTITNIAHIAVENVKIVGQMASGKLTAKEGVEKIEETTVSTVAGISASAKGSLIGANIGAVLGPVGVAVGGFIGGTVGYMAGSKVGEGIVKFHRKVREKAVQVLKKVGETVHNVAESIVSGLRSLLSW